MLHCAYAYASCRNGRSFKKIILNLTANEPAWTPLKFCMRSLWVTLCWNELFDTWWLPRSWAEPISLLLQMCNWSEEKKKTIEIENKCLFPTRHSTMKTEFYFRNFYFYRFLHPKQALRVLVYMRCECGEWAEHRIRIREKCRIKSIINAGENIKSSIMTLNIDI